MRPIRPRATPTPLTLFMVCVQSAKSVMLNATDPSGLYADSIVNSKIDQVNEWKGFPTSLDNSKYTNTKLVNSYNYT